MDQGGVLVSALRFLREAGLVGVLMLILFGGWKRWWVWGHQVDRVIAHFEEQLRQRCAERDDWKRMAMGQAAVVPPPDPYAGPDRRRGERRSAERRRSPPAAPAE